jgi:hypothetical protein
MAGRASYAFAGLHRSLPFPLLRSSLQLLLCLPLLRDSLV